MIAVAEEDDSDWLLKTVVPKSDQLNADDLMEPIRVSIVGVTKMASKEQPVVIAISGGYKPWKPCLTMRRVLIALWTKDPKTWIGREVVLVNDPTVKWGGQAVGGIRIAYMSDIPASIQLMVTVSRGQRKPVTIERLETAPKEPGFLASWKQRIKAVDFPPEVMTQAKLIADAFIAKDVAKLDEIHATLDVVLLKHFAESAKAKLITVPA